MLSTSNCQVFVVSTMFGLVSVVAALDGGLFPDAARRVLVCSNNTHTPETTPSVPAMDGFAALSARFDRVVTLNSDIAPLHPAEWSPRAIEAPSWERYLRQAWGLGSDPIHLLLESIQVSPAQALCRIFPDAAIDVYADGLMGYSPTRTMLPVEIGSRISRLLHLDLVPNLEPLLLSEWGVDPVIIPGDRFTKIIAAVSDALPFRYDSSRPVALILGQYLSALGIMSAEEEQELYLGMLRGLVELGHQVIIFKPHPSSGHHLSLAMEAEATRLDVSCSVLTEPWLAEYLFHRMDVARVVSCFSTGLMTAHTFYGLQVAQLGAISLLDRLSPFQNSNRIPATLVADLVPELGSLPAGDAPASITASPRLRQLVVAVGYAMQPGLYPHLRMAAETFLDRHLVDNRRYFKRRRLTMLRLPGALPARTQVPRRFRLSRVLAKLQLRVR